MSRSTSLVPLHLNTITVPFPYAPAPAPAPAPGTFGLGKGESGAGEGDRLGRPMEERDEPEGCRRRLLGRKLSVNYELQDSAAKVDKTPG